MKTKTEIARDMRRGAKGLSLSPETQFEKGYTPKNKLPVGTQTIRIDKNGNQRRWIKVDDPNFWIPNAQYVWLSNSGTIPDGFILHHIDFNTLDDDVSNLCLVTRSAHIQIHRDTLEKARPKLTKIKRKMCPGCGKEYMGRGRFVARCVDCARSAARERGRVYKQRKRNQRD